MEPCAADAVIRADAVRFLFGEIADLAGSDQGESQAQYNSERHFIAPHGYDRCDKAEGREKKRVGDKQHDWVEDFAVSLLVDEKKQVQVPLGS